MQPDLILTPFGENATPGTIEPIPETRSPGDIPQKANWDEGFPLVTMTPLAAGGLPPQGQDFNGIFKAISEQCVYTGGGGQYQWSSAYITKNGGYQKGAVIQSDDGLNSYVSLVNSNAANFNTTPGSIGTSWALYAGRKTQSQATETVAGIAEIASQSEVTTGADDERIVTPAKLRGAQATQAEAEAGTDNTKLMTPFRSRQLLSIAKGVSRHTASGSFTVPAGVTKIWVSGCAAGGGAGAGGGAAGASRVGSGGGGGGAGQSTISTPFSVTPGQVIAITTGTAGVGGGGDTGGGNGNPGTVGGNTVVGSLITLAGGGAGLGGVNALSGASAGSVGGSGFPAGGIGTDSTNGSASAGGGMGASSPFGGGGAPGRGGSSAGGTIGRAAGGFGGGGGGGGGAYSAGGGTGANGGSGTGGLVVIEY